MTTADVFLQINKIIQFNENINLKFPLVQFQRKKFLFVIV
jgi:hypothetical protein